MVTSAALATAAMTGVGSRADALALALAPGATRRIVSAADELGSTNALAVVEEPVAAIEAVEGR